MHVKKINSNYIQMISCGSCLQWGFRTVKLLHTQLITFYRWMFYCMFGSLSNLKAVQHIQAKGSFLMQLTGTFDE